MDLGRQCTYTGIRTLPIEGHGKEKLFSLWTVRTEQDSDGSNGWVPIVIGVDPGERAVTW